MKKILQTVLFVCMTLTCSQVNAQTKPKKPVNGFEGAEKALLVKTPKIKTTNQVGSNDINQQRSAKPVTNKSKTSHQFGGGDFGQQRKAKPKPTKGSQ